MEDLLLVNSIIAISLCLEVVRALGNRETNFGKEFIEIYFWRLICNQWSSAFTEVCSVLMCSVKRQQENCKECMMYVNQMLVSDCCGTVITKNEN